MKQIIFIGPCPIFSSEKYFVEGAKSAAMIMFDIASANLFAWLMVSAQIPAIAAKAISTISANKYVFLLLVNIFFLITGSLLDTPAAIVIIVPILEPLAVNLGNFLSKHWVFV